MQRIIQANFKALGTEIEIKIVSSDEKSKKTNKILEELKLFYFKKQKIFSRFDGESELSQLNKNIGKYNEASCDIIETARKALCYNKTTGGFFDPRIIETLEGAGYDRNFSEINPEGKVVAVGPLQTNLTEDLKINGNKIRFNCRMDFSGLAKGYITDRAAEFLRGSGFGNFLIDSGGDMNVAGTDENKNPWHISIEGIDEQKLSFKLSNKGIATSGITRKKWEKNGQKFHHLINPQKPQEFLFNLKTVTVISENTESADVWAKVLFLMGRESGMKYSNENNIASGFLDYRGNTYLSSEIRNFAIAL